MTKFRVLAENERRPALGLVLGFKPDAKQIRGIGKNSTDVFAATILEKRFGKLRGPATWAPRTPFEHNDVLIYGAAFSNPFERRVNLVGEVAGRYSWRKILVELAVSTRTTRAAGSPLVSGRISASLDRDPPSNRGRIMHSA